MLYVLRHIELKAQVQSTCHDMFEWLAPVSRAVQVEVLHATSSAPPSVAISASPVEEGQLL